MRILVTGANGFSGRHLIEKLSNRGCWEIYRTALTPSREANFFSCDLTHEDEAAALIERIAPDHIYHLAGTFTNDYETDYAVNVRASRNLLEAVRQSNRRCRVLLVGSSAEYGLVPPQNNPVKEDHPLVPVSVYGLTKVYQTYLGKLYFTIHSLNVVTARPFNLLGHGLSRHLFVGYVYEQIDAYRSGKIAKISVGNMESRRDYITVEQAVQAYEIIMQRGTAGEIYNVGSGVSVKIRDLLKRILEENGLDMDVVEERPAKLTDKSDIPDLFADVSKLRVLMAASE